MAVFHLEDDRPERRPTPINPHERDLGRFREELAGYYATMREFRGRDVGPVLQELASMSARASEIRHYLVDGETRPQAAFRTKQLDPFLEEVERQFKLYSRIQSTLEMEWKLAGAHI
jgi:hypothetical protein